MQLIYQENPSFSDPVHEADLQYMLSNTYTNTSFFLQTITKDGSSYTYWGDVQKNLYFVSDNFRDRFGFERNIVEDLPRKWVDIIYNPIDKKRYLRDNEKLFREKLDTFDQRYQVADQDGCVFWVHCFGRIEWNPDKTVPMFYCGKISVQDITLTIDPITSFPGEEIIMNHLSRIAEYHRRCFCIGFSLNHIDKINSIQGRTYGKRLIHDIAQDLIQKSNKLVTYYRLDSDSFIAVLSGTANITYQKCIEEIQSIIESNYRKMGFPVEESCSFAMMQFPKDGLTVIDFLGDMITLIQMAREKPDLPFLDERSEAVYQIQKQNSIEYMLRKNVTDGMVDFRAVIQPIVSAETGKIIGGETLMRWKDSEYDVSPGIFIPILESSSLIHKAGIWIFEEAVKTCKRVISLIPDFYLTVNVSVRQLYNPNFYKFIPDVLKKYDLDGKHIVIEVTESCLNDEPQNVQRLVKVCESCGIRIALDDFGTGYSSMHVLLEYPLNVVKIDRSLLLDMSSSEDKYNFISCIVFACHQFGKMVCIEGVENDKQKKLANQAGCDMIQGFYYYRPLEIDRFFKIIEDSEATES